MLNFDNFFQQKNINWCDPLSFASKVNACYGQKNWAFLYSGLSDTVPNSFSYIALFPRRQIKADDFAQVKDDGLWLGYLSYELGWQFEELPEVKKSHIDLPKVWLIDYALILRFDHKEQRVTAFFDDEGLLDEVLAYKDIEVDLDDFKVEKIDSNFNDTQYLEEIRDIKNMIARGDFYQTNLTRKFFGNIDAKKDHKFYFSLFHKLCQLSPANYSSFLALDGNYVISASPELFLTLDNQGAIKSRPIKGTTPRCDDKKQDELNRLELQNSAKEKAENLMIVDLVRNDLSRVCKAPTVEVKKLFEITSYSNIHHLSSLVVGQIDENCDLQDILRACFPAGSMTGAPKIKAMEVAANKEKMSRGVYSGAIGFVGNSQINLSVVIRTLIFNDENFEFQLGGAITFDSKEDKELEEIYSKGRGISKLLGLE